MEACAPLSEEHKLALWSSYNNIVRALINAGEGDQSGIDAYIEADARLLAIKCKTFLPALRVEAARRALALGLKQQAHNLALMAEDQMRETGEVYALSDLHRLKGTLAMERGDVRAAEASLKEAVNVAKEQGSLMWELRACIDLARLLQAQHRIDEAISVLRPVHDSIEEGDCPDDRSAAGNLLAELV